MIAMDIKRDFYLNQLIERKHNGLIKVITGIRRCGKSYLLNHIFYQYLRNSGVPDSYIISFAFDSAEDLLKIGEDPVAILKGERNADPGKFLTYIAKRTTDPGEYYLLLDEVQFLDAFEGVLNSFLQHAGFDIYVTGSNSKFLSSDIITEFRGRGDELHIFPLSFSEFHSAYDGERDDAWDEYITYGGLPMVLAYQSHERKSAYLQTLYNETYFSDIAGRHRIQNRAALEALTDILASSVGSLTNPEKIADTFKSNKNKISAVTVDKYITYLKESFLIHSARRYDVKGRKYIGSPYKFYFEDVGLRNARLNFRQQEETHLMENIIYNELRRRGYNVDVGVVEIYSTAETGKQEHLRTEIDFVVNSGTNKIYIQSAFSMETEKKVDQKLRPLKNTRDFFKKIVVVRGGRRVWTDDDGIVHMGLFEFLLNEHSVL